MKRLVWAIRHVEELEDVICNRCGKSIAAGPEGGYEAATLSASWEHGSRKACQCHESHLCEGCYDEVVAGFKHPPFIGDDLEDTGPSIELDSRQRRARRGEGLLRIEARPGYKLYVVHADGRAAEIDMSDVLHGPAFASLRDPALFAQARLDKW